MCVCIPDAESRAISSPRSLICLSASLFWYLCVLPLFCFLFFCLNPAFQFSPWGEIAFIMRKRAFFFFVFLRKRENGLRANLPKGEMEGEWEEEEVKEKRRGMNEKAGRSPFRTEPTSLLPLDPRQNQKTKKGTISLLRLFA